MACQFSTSAVIVDASSSRSFWAVDDLDPTPSALRGVWRLRGLSVVTTPVCICIIRVVVVVILKKRVNVTKLIMDISA